MDETNIKKLNLRLKISYMLSLFLFLSIFSIIISGRLMMKSTTYDRVMFWKMLPKKCSSSITLLIRACLKDLLRSLTATLYA